MRSATALSSCQIKTGPLLISLLQVELELEGAVAERTAERTLSDSLHYRSLR